VRTFGLRPSSLAFAAVLVWYWIPALVALRWGLWSGGDPIELGLSLRNHYWTELSSPANLLIAAPLVLAGTVVAIWRLARARRAGTPDDRLWLVGAALLGVPCVLMMLMYAVIIGGFLIGCSITRCSLF
jgi:hypothetical protein